MQSTNEFIDQSVEIPPSVITGVRPPSHRTVGNDWNKMPTTASLVGDIATSATIASNRETNAGNHWSLVCRSEGNASSARNWIAPTVSTTRSTTRSACCCRASLTWISSRLVSSSKSTTVKRAGIKLTTGRPEDEIGRFEWTVIRYRFSAVGSPWQVLFEWTLHSHQCR